MIWVVDASVAVRWFLKDEGHPNADAVLYTLIDRPESFAVPELFCFEVYAVLCRLHPSGHDVFIKGMIPILNSGVFRQPMTERLANQAARFVKKGLTGYDATYVALATEMKGRWLTFDEKAHKCLAREKVSHILTKHLPQNWL
ncbi:MAG: type II toxin-antitoxin system VapC family toxin [Deltaproteobacteria bacterium]|nr:type II toxin-antitoxin system VapC family toxin [Deltaproteobacteria bacterium]MBW2035731.1 type II toxin-antitoxin system VapC family toxin [Deltaproteobacteria bacterium]